MRGKNILSLTMIVMFISVAFVNIGYAQEELPVLTVLPETIRGLPGDYFDVTITITNVEDLWAYGFTLDFAPFTSTLNVIAVIEDPWFREGSPPWPHPMAKTWFTYNVDTFNGEVYIGATRRAKFVDYGMSGSATLVTIKFAVVEAGRSPLDLINTELLKRIEVPGGIPEYELMPHNVVNAEYLGPTATLKHPKGKITEKVWKVGDTQTFHMNVKNRGDVPLYVRVRYTLQREDGEACYIWTGQSYTGFGPQVVDTAYVDGYIDIGWNDWNLAGPPEAMIGEPDGAYIESGGDCALQALYTFEDIDTKGRIVENVEFYGYSKCGDTGSDIDSMINWLGGFQLAWGNSQGGTLDWAWTNKRYYWPAYNFPEYYGFPLDQPVVEEAINTATMAIHNYHGGWQQVDAYRMDVTYSRYTPAQGNEAAYLVQPGETISVEPAVWFLSSYDTGHYYASATVYYSYYGTWFVRGHNPPAFNFEYTVEP